MLAAELKGDNSTPNDAHSNGARTSSGTNEHSIKALIATEAGITGNSKEREEREEAEIAETAVAGMDEEETLEAVREFRKNVAGLLALGSRLRELKGAEKYMFERRRREAENKDP